MEQLYKLNLPSLDQILLESAIPLLSEGTDKSLYRTYLAADIIKPEWMKFLGYKWHIALYFYKPPNCIGRRVHTDGIDSKEKPWGINWIWGGSGTMYYWNTSTLPEPIIVTDQCGHIVHEYVNNIPADYTYHMAPGAYLANVTLPHVASSSGNRYCVSLRSPSSSYLEWSDIVESFKDYIVT